MAPGTRAALWPVAVAIGSVSCAALAPPVPVWFGGGLLVASLVRVRPAPLAGSIILMCGALGAQAQLGTQPIDTGPFEGIVQLTHDPENSGTSTSVLVRTSRGRLRLVASGVVAGRIQSLSAGDRVAVTGRTVALTHVEPSRHLRGTLVVRSVGQMLDRTPLISAIEALRSSISRGAEVLPDQQRPLYLGFVLGDDRGSSPVVDADLEASGLGHLTVVSGENLTFVLLVFSPLLARVGLRRRFILAFVILVMFAAVTRFEPSILRATAMACVLAVTVRLGRPSSPMRILSLAVVALVLLDPLIVWSLGFRLSLAATTGIVLLARPISRRIPGPRRFALAVAVPVAAQLGVAPIAIPALGAQPLLGVPANVLVEPAAALVMMWGCTAGLLAGVAGTRVAWLLHRPTELALHWVLSVARFIGELPPLRVGIVAVTTMACAAVLVHLIGGRKRMFLAVGCLIAVGAFAVFGTGPGNHELTDESLAGARVWSTGIPQRSTVVVVDGRVDVGELLVELHIRGLRRIDLLVRSSKAVAAVEAARLLDERLDVIRMISLDELAATGDAAGPPSEVGPFHVARASSGVRVDVAVERVHEPNPAASGR